jgi:hypothetical protein
MNITPPSPDSIELNSLFFGFKTSTDGDVRNIALSRMQTPSPRQAYPIAKGKFSILSAAPAEDSPQFFLDWLMERWELQEKPLTEFRNYIYAHPTDWYNCETALLHNSLQAA